MSTFAEYLEKWLKQSTSKGLTNPLVKMPVKRFRLLQPSEFKGISNGGTHIIGTMSDAVCRNLHKNYQTRIRERGEHCGYICSGSIEMIVAGDSEGKQRKQLFPVLLKRASLQTSGENIKVSVADEESWQFNPVLQAHLRSFAIQIPSSISTNPDPVQATHWVKAQLGNRASQVSNDSYVGLFSSQQMVVQNRLTEPPLRQALARNPVIRAKIDNQKLPADLNEVTDDGMEELGLSLPCDDSQLRVIQLANSGLSLQVEGPPGTGKSQTIANIISNALYHGRNVLLVCDKKAAIVQVEERLSDVGLAPAMLNLHDEDLDKRAFLKQATSKFPISDNPRAYPFAELQEARQTLNDRVRFGRKIAHPSLQISKREGLAGMIQLRKELQKVPKIPVENWQSLSRDRLAKLLGCLGEWPDLDSVISNSKGVWNRVKVEAFDNNPNAENELKSAIGVITSQIESLQTIREWAATVGIELKLNSNSDVKDMLAFVTTVLAKPDCHLQLIGNSSLSLVEVDKLKSQWIRRESIVAENHPVELSDKFAKEPDKTALFRAEQLANEILLLEKAKTWEELSKRVSFHQGRCLEFEASQNAYRRICEQIGLVYSPFLAVRRAQLQAVISLASVGVTVPRGWWKADTSPVHTLGEWKSHFHACASHAKSAPLPMHFVALERVATTHWQYVEAKAEHGFNLISYCLHYVNDRKCKYALRQVFPSIPIRGFDQWQEITLHAVTALRTVTSLRTASETHVQLKKLTSSYLAVAHDKVDGIDAYLSSEEVLALEQMAAHVEQLRDRNDLFEVSGVHWQTFWESINAFALNAVKDVLLAFDSLGFPENQTSDNIEDAIVRYAASGERIRDFLGKYETKEGNRHNSVIAGFIAQKNFAECNEKLLPLEKYLGIQKNQESGPDWEWLAASISWRDKFERLRGSQKLDIDSRLWLRLKEALETHQSVMSEARRDLDELFEDISKVSGDYDDLLKILTEIISDLPRRSRWEEKKRWSGKIGAFPEISPLWSKLLDGSVDASQGQKLFCFNLLRLCDPITKPHGAEFKQTLGKFAERDEKLASWVIDHLKANLRSAMDEASRNCTSSESRLRSLSSMQRVRGTVRELVNAHADYLLAAKRCWLMSPTSLANLIDSKVFEEHGVPFDLVVFDEASQIRVLDGLLSMAFGKQIIIVGDKNQLPPTDFFGGFANPEAEDDDFGTSESLLEEFGGVFEENKTQVMLMSHYRSETPDLIRFSNDFFYGGKLDMYPPAHISGTGRRLHYVPNANYSETGERNNPAEAKEVVTLIEHHVRDNPDKSLGVVTMNIAQMEAIEERLRLANDSKLRSFCSDESKFFLRNLETVQGDEMDRIILSLTYGRNSKGVFNASVLGPLNKSGGERRLNVAITRSRSGMTIVSSLRVADLDQTGASSRGFVCLKEFLAELENEEQARTFGIGNKRFERSKDGVSNIVYCESPFEEQVVEFLENHGFEIECQHGAGKYRIDIVVKDRGRNVLAIECDGAAYHSSLVARTRDRARQRILEKLGWRIHRVWSTNWWHSEQQEQEAIIAAINSALQQDKRQGNSRPSATAEVSASRVVETGSADENDDPEVVVDEAGNVRAISINDAGESAESEALDTLLVIGNVTIRVDEFLKKVNQLIKPGKRIPRETLLEEVAESIGASVKATRPMLNRIISQERTAGRLDVTPNTWEQVWRT